MTRKVIGIFHSQGQAEEAVNQLREEGFDRDISILAKEGNDKEGKERTTMEDDSVADGATTGGVLGGLTGLAVGAGALVIPGIGPLIAAGPIAGLLSGAATGGLGGALVDWGVPEAESRRYEEEVRRGRILVSVECNDDKVDMCQEILQKKGANEVKSH
ncbi:MAG: DUF1269 domain-containing protein [Bacillota bacterium]|nr:DUF1269 domain-containing protein [Bacillota bacterium]